MGKETIKSLTAKGYSQKKIAKTLGIRKMKVVTYQKTHKIGKRAVQPFWENVKTIREMKGVSWQKAKTEVKYSKKWFVKRQTRLKGIEKAKDQYGELWQRVKEGDVDVSIFETKEAEGIAEYAGYD